MEHLSLFLHTQFLGSILDEKVVKMKEKEGGKIQSNALFCMWHRGQKHELMPAILTFMILIEDQNIQNARVIYDLQPRPHPKELLAMDCY